MNFFLFLRSAGYGWASVCARIGGIIAPQNKTLSNLSIHLPFTVVGILTAICCLLCLVLTDTYTEPLSDHVDMDLDDM